MKFDSSKEAKLYTINKYRECIISGRQDQLVACHIWPAGSYPELKSYSENIVPLYYSLHTNKDDTLDWIIFQKKARTPVERILYLLKHVNIEYKNQLIKQLYDLVKVMSSIPRHEYEAEIIFMLLANHE